MSRVTCQLLAPVKVACGVLGAYAAVMNTYGRSCHTTCINGIETNAFTEESRSK